MSILRRNLTSVSVYEINFDEEDQLITIELDAVSPEMVYEEHPASVASQLGLSIAIGFLGLWSTIGNILTILAIISNHNMRSKCNHFILSLAISDLISGLIASPLWVYRRTWGFQTWNWGSFLCKTFWFVDESTSYCTAMHIASFAVWRYMGVRWPYTVERIRKCTIRVWICTIWTIAIVFGGVIFSTFYSLNDKSKYKLDEKYAHWPSCTIKIPDNGVEKHLIFYTVSTSVFLLLPMAVLFLSSILLVKELFWHKHHKGKARKRKERRAVYQLALIAASFLLGYIPMTTYVMWTTRTPNNDKKLDYWTHVASYFCLRISESMNPIIYNIASKKMRKSSMRVIHYIKNCCRSDAEIDFLNNCPACKKAYFSPQLFRISREYKISRSNRQIRLNSKENKIKTFNKGKLPAKKNTDRRTEKLDLNVSKKPEKCTCDFTQPEFIAVVRDLQK